MDSLSQFSLAGKRALITGSSRGIGFAIAAALAGAGADIILNSRDPETLGKAAAELADGIVVGSRADELRALRETVRKMLKENGSPPDGKWADIALLEPVRDYKARHASTLLTFDAVVSAIDTIEAKRRETAVAS